MFATLKISISNFTEEQEEIYNLPKVMKHISA